MKKIIWISAILLLLAVSALSVLLWTESWLRESGREKAIHLLEESFDDVQLAELDFRWQPTFSGFFTVIAEGSSLAVSLKDRPGVPPFISMKEFSVDLNMLRVWREPVRVRQLRLRELVIRIPPKEEGADEAESSAEEERGGEGKEIKRIPPNLVIESLIADGTTLLILNDDPQRDPLRFDLHELETTSVRSDAPLSFEALLDNPKPPGQIATNGEFGPFHPEDVGQTPVSGEYLFEDADLSVFGGIGGILSSEGTFEGELRRIEVEGWTRVPGFFLGPVGNPMLLTTEFEAIVDGTSGDTYLEPVRAKLGDSSFVTRGAVAKEVEGEGKTIVLQAEAGQGRVEDFLRLAVPSEELLMTGAITFESKIVIPPEDRDVTEKIFLDGSFQLEGIRFPNEEVQAKVNELSDLGLGKRGDDEAEREREAAAPSNVGGEFVLEDGMMTIRDLSFEVPGAQITLLGHYGLKNQEVNFKGELRSEAEVSEMTDGIKSLLLKAVDPLFKRDGSGAVIPIKITGTPKEIEFGVEKGRILTRRDAEMPKE